MLSAHIDVIVGRCRLLPFLRVQRLLYEIPVQLPAFLLFSVPAPQRLVRRISQLLDRLVRFIAVCDVMPLLFASGQEAFGQIEAPEFVLKMRAFSR